MNSDVVFIDLFSGIGGFHTGLEKAGMKCVGWCEKDKFAQKSYRALYNTERLWFADDIRKCRGWEMPNANIWAFGFPCQDISVAGKQKGIKQGTRSGLFFEVMRLLDEKEESQPEWLIIENVKNLLSIDSGWGFFTILSEMAKRGYNVQWRVYNSKDYGVPQNRERVYIVGHLGERCGRELLPVARKSERALKKVIDGSQGDRVYEPNLSCTLSSQGGGMGAKTGLYMIQKGCKFRYPERGIGKRAVSGYVELTDIAGALTARHCGDYTSDRNTGVVEIKNATKSGMLPARVGDGIETAYSSSNMRRARVQPGRCSTITTHGTAGVLMDTSPVRIRKLTPKECWRLQGFTDEQFEKAAKVNSNTQLYKQAGNAVTVNVVEEIGKHIMKIIKEKSK